jgi:uncharacterized protein
VQGAIGFGAALVVVPVLGLVAPEALPATVIIWAMPLVVAMAVRERHGVDWSGVGWMTFGRLPGVAVGAWVVSAVAADTLSVLAGCAVLLAVVTSLIATTVRVTRTTKTAAGFASGVMGTATSIGGPPLALLYQHHQGVVLRSTLATTFVVGIMLTLGGLAVAGAVEGWHVLLALALLPGQVAGLTISRSVTRHLDERWLRHAVLAVVSVTAAVAIGNGLA